MTAPDPAPLDLAARALGFSSGGDAQVTVTRERSLLSRFAVSRPTQATRVDDESAHVLVVRDGHVGAAETNELTDDGLRAAVRRAEAAADAVRAGAGGAVGEHPGLPPAPAAYPTHAGLDLPTTRLDPAVAGAALRSAFDAAGACGLEAFGAWTAGHVTTAIASSTGIAATDDVTDAHLKVIARDPRTGRTGWGAGMAPALADLDVAAVVARAVGKVVAAAGAEPLDLAPGAYPVVLEADAVGLLLDMLGAVAFNGLAQAEGRGALVDRLGTPVAGPAIDLADAPGAARTLPRAFDAEGVPKRDLPLIHGGVARQVIHDTRSAARAGGGATSTGHAVVPGGSPYGPACTNLVLAPGAAADEAELCAPVERGLYVTRLWYLNVVHERSALLTGTTRDGTFLIEDGRITRPVRDVRFTDSPLRLLAETEALGRRQALVGEADFYGRRFASGVLCPPLRAQGFRVTGATVA
jgi:PmbA protein